MSQQSETNPYIGDSIFKIYICVNALQTDLDWGCETLVCIVFL